MRVAHMVIDMQFGSTGKGSLVGYLANQNHYDTVVAAWGPNAGHTFIDSRGVAYINTMLPIAAIHPSVEFVLLGPGSVLNLQDLWKEIEFAVLNSEEHAPHFILIIHPQAMVVRDRHREVEKQFVRVGSTMKGTGAALVEKIMRDPSVSPLVRDIQTTPDGRLAWEEFTERCDKLGISVLKSENAYNDAVDASRRMMIEGAQGFSLGLNRRFWPHTTSREITPPMVLADCALPLMPVTVYGTLRTFPIRVANRYKDGVQIGSSGGFYPDQREMQWSELGMEPELTTVTKLPRRIFTFSFEQLEDALRLCTPRVMFLNFANYLGNRQEHGAELTHLIRAIDNIASSHGARIGYLGWGPTIDDVEEV